MSNMKRLLALSLALVMIFSLTCGSFAYAMDDGEVVEEAVAEDVIEEAAEELIEEPAEEPV